MVGPIFPDVRAVAVPRYGEDGEDDAQTSLHALLANLGANGAHTIILNLNCLT